MWNWLTVFSMAHPWVFCLLFCPVAAVAVVTLAIVFFRATFYLPATFVFKCWNRWLRSRNIKHHGWPPSHLDADGDFEKGK
jgi:hypothetical protein